VEKKLLKIIFLYSGKALDEEGKIFVKLAERKGIELIPYNVFNRVSFDGFVKELKDCDLVYNATAEDYALEYSKLAEVFGKKVVDSPKEYYSTEDKWMFYVKCMKYGVPVPDTILLPRNISMAKKALKDFNKWPVVLKRIYGTWGWYVEKADNADEAAEIIRKFWEKGSEKLPIIAQEFIYSPSYRATVINGKIVQTVIKKNYGLKAWKATGIYGKKFKRFPVDKELKKLVKNLMSFVKIHICGIDLCKKGDSWLLIEVNSSPAFDFLQSDHEYLIDLSLDLLKKEALKLKK